MLLSFLLAFQYLLSNSLAMVGNYNLSQSTKSQYCFTPGCGSGLLLKPLPGKIGEGRAFSLENAPKSTGELSSPRVQISTRRILE
jgi:hypothetical protein